MKILVTGIAGFVGSHMADFLLERNLEVIGLVREDTNLEPISHILNKIDLIYCDILDFNKLKQVVRQVSPDRVFHYVAQGVPGISFEKPVETFNTNVIGTIYLLEAIKDAGIEPIIHIPCSGAEYGVISNNANQINETHALNPIDPYGISKASQDWLVFAYFNKYNMKIFRSRGFTHTGPRQKPNFVCSHFAKQIAEIEVGLKKPFLYVGNLHPKRYFTDVRDMVRAYWLLVEQCNPGEVYNISSNQVYSIKEVLEILLSMTEKEIVVKKDAEMGARKEISSFVPDTSKFQQATGWTIEIPFRETMSDLLNYWRAKVESNEKS